jgi:hypothetical protein
VCASRQCTCGHTAVVVRKHCCQSYGQYDVNEFRFRLTIFKASHLLAATTNTGVVTRDVDAKGHEFKYYEMIKNIIEYNFAGNKNLKTMFFDCDWFNPNQGTRENKFGMVEVKHVHRLCGCNPFVLAHQVEQVYYMSYLREKLSALWVVNRVNPRERLHTPDDSGYHKNQVPAGEVDEVYQDDELPCSFNIGLELSLNSLLGDANDVTVPEQRKQTLRKKKKCKILNIIYISYHVLYISYSFMLYPITRSLYFSYTLMLMNTHLCLF